MEDLPEMDIELDQENFMKYMGGEDNKSDQLEGETMLLQQIEDQKSKKDSNKFKAINDFKARVLDFLSIYVKEVKDNIDSNKRMIITRGLLDAMAVAHKDKSEVLFEKIRHIIVTMAKGSKAASDGNNDEESEKNNKTILFTEILSKILNPKIDSKVSRVYRTAFFYVIKSLKEEKGFKKLIRSSYKELLKCYLQKRASNTLNQEFFQNAFNADIEFSYSFFKFLLKCSLPIPKKDNDEKNTVEGARTLKQRFLAIELLHFIVKRTRKVNEETLLRKLGDNFDLLSQCTVAILEDMSNMKHRLMNTSKILNLFIDTGLCLKYSSLKDNFAATVDKQAEEIMNIVLKLSEEKYLNQLKERVKHLKKLISI